MRVYFLTIVFTLSNCVAVFAGGYYVTERNVETDRCASIWLIKKFIDPEATFTFIDPGDTVPDGAITFDFFGADYFHKGPDCTYTSLVKAHGLHTDGALLKINEFVNDVFAWRWGKDAFPRKLREHIALLRENGLADEVIIGILSSEFDLAYFLLTETNVNGEIVEDVRFKSTLSKLVFEPVLKHDETRGEFFKLLQNYAAKACSDCHFGFRVEAEEILVDQELDWQALADYVVLGPDGMTGLLSDIESNVDFPTFERLRFSALILSELVPIGF